MNLLNVIAELQISFLKKQKDLLNAVTMLSFSLTLSPDLQEPLILPLLPQVKYYRVELILMLFINQKDFLGQHVILKMADHLPSWPQHLQKQDQKWMMLSLRNLKVPVIWNYS